MSTEPDREALLRRIDERAQQRRRRRWRVQTGVTTMAVLVVVGVAVSVARQGSPQKLQTATTAPATTATAGTPTTRPETPPCPTPAGKYTLEELSAIRPDIEAMLGSSLLGVGQGPTALVVMLAPANEALAAALVDRFGDRVQITVGATNYCGEPGVSPPCPALEGSDDLPPGVSLELKLDKSSIRADERLNGVLTVRYDGSDSITGWDPGLPIVAMIVLPGSRTVAAVNTNALAGVGIAGLQPGEQRDLPVVVGTARCGGYVGSGLPPGTYGVRAGIGPNEGSAEYLAPEVPLTITE
ncbi:MAG: hypothetical protein ABIV94_01065 [Acidimicrobiales bacterium]